MGQTLGVPIACGSFCDMDERRIQQHEHLVLPGRKNSHNHLTLQTSILDLHSQLISENSNIYSPNNLTPNGQFDWGYGATPMSNRPHWSTPRIAKNAYSDFIELEDDNSGEIDWDPDVICEFIHENISRNALEFLWYEYDVRRHNVMGDTQFTELVRKILSEYVHRVYSAEAVDMVPHEIDAAASVIMRNLRRTLTAWEQDPSRIMFSDYQDFFLDLISSPTIIPLNKRDLFERMRIAPAIVGQVHFDSIDFKRRLDAAVDESDMNKISRLLVEMTSQQRQTVMSSYPHESALREQIDAIFESRKVAIRNPHLVQDTIHALLSSPTAYDCHQIRTALYPVKKKQTVDLEGLVDIISTRCNFELRKIREEYGRLFGSDLISDVNTCVENDVVLKSILKRALRLERDEMYRVDQDQSRLDAEMLRADIQQMKNVNPNTVISIFCERSWTHLRDMMFNYNRKSSGLTLAATLKRVWPATSPMGKWMDTVLMMTKSCTQYFARQLHRSTRGRRTDSILQRCLLTRCEIDAISIQLIFGEMYGEGQSLRRRLEECTPSGLYREILLVLAGHKTKWLSADRDAERMARQQDEAYADHTEDADFVSLHDDFAIDIAALGDDLHVDDDGVIELVDASVEMIDSPTVLDASHFSAEQDAVLLQHMMSRASGNGRNKDKSKKLKTSVMGVLCYRSTMQRKMIRDVYQYKFGRDLLEDINENFGGELRALFRVLLKTRGQRLATCVETALEKSNLGLLTKIICELPNTWARELCDAYPENLVSVIRRELIGREHLVSLLVTILRGDRLESTTVDERAALNDAVRLRDAYEAKRSSKVDQLPFVNILSTNSFHQIHEIARMFQTISRQTLTGIIRASTFDDSFVGVGCLTIVEMAVDRHRYFARQLFDAQQVRVIGSPFKYSTIIRIVTSRAEVDLGFIIRAFNETQEQVDGSTFQKWLLTRVDKTFTHALLSLCGLESTMSFSSTIRDDETQQLFETLRRERDNNMSRALALEQNLSNAPMRNVRLKEIQSVASDDTIASVDDVFQFESFAVFCETKIKKKSRDKLWMKWADSSDGKLNADKCRAVVEFVAVAYYGNELKTNYGVRKLSPTIKDEVQGILGPFVRWMRRVKFRVKKSGRQDESAFLGKSDFMDVIVRWIREFDARDEM